MRMMRPESFSMTKDERVGLLYSMGFSAGLMWALNYINEFGRWPTGQEIKYALVRSERLSARLLPVVGEEAETSLWNGVTDPKPV